VLGSLIIVAAQAAATAAAAPPQESSSPGGEGGEVIVTGERVARTVRRTPSSVEVVGARELEAQPGADRLETVLELVPNVQFGTGGQGPTIRGQDSGGVLQDLPAFLGGTRPRTTLQVDGRAVSFNEFLFGVAPLWDVRQVEVFRSPQTTTQGRNAIAGAIFVHTREPTQHWESAVRALIGDHDTRQLSAVASGPLVADQLAFRVAGDVRRGRTSSLIADRVEGADPNRDRYGVLRAKLLAEPSAWPGARVGLTFTHSRSKMPQIEGVRPPFKARKDPIDGYGTFETRVDALTASADLPLSGAVNSRTTLSLGEARVQRFAPRGLGEAVNAIADRSIETILGWQAGEQLDVTAGLHHLRTRLDQAIDLSAVVGIGAFDDRQHSLGLFGEATLRPAPRLSLTAGLRYQEDRQDRSGAFAASPFPTAIDFKQTYRAWLPKASLAYDLSSTATAGVLVQRAYNPGGISLHLDTGRQVSFDAETLWAYELFGRAGLGRRLSLSSNIFYKRFSDAQRAQSRLLSIPGRGTATWAVIHNVPSAQTYGGEAGVEWSPLGQLRLRASAGLLRTRIREAPKANPLFEGKEFQRSPHFTGSARAEWTPRARTRLSAALRHNSRYFSDDLETPSRIVGAATRLDLRAAQDIGRVTVFGHVRNLLDAFDMTYLFSPTFGTAAEPRKFAIGLEARF